MASRAGDADNAAMFVGYFDVEDSNNVNSCQQEIVTLEPLASTSRQREDAVQCVNIRIHDHNSDRVDDSQEGLGQKPISSIDKTLDKRTEYVSADKFDAFMERHDNQLSLITASLQSLSEGFSYYEEECDYEEDLESNVTSGRMHLSDTQIDRQCIGSFGRSNDVKLHTIQRVLLKGLTPLVILVNKLVSGIEVPDKKELSQTMLDSIALLATSSYSLSQYRQTNLKQYLKDDYQSLCTPKTKSTDQLFGDDVVNKIKSLTEGKMMAVMVAHKPQFSNPSSTRGFGGFGGFRGFSRGRGGTSRRGGRRFLGRGLQGFASLEDIDWWCVNISNSSEPVQRGSPSITLMTDASLVGWGAECLGLSTGGQWSEEELNFSNNINYLELQALVMLTALVTGQRCQTLKFLDLNYYDVVGDNVCFRIMNLLKQSRPGVHLNAVDLKKYRDSDLCVVRTLEVYIHRTAHLRGDHTQLFITHSKPLKPVIKTIDTDILTRAASTSATINDILKAAGWSNERWILPEKTVLIWEILYCRLR
ncbi:unnamed protein product [Mytilus coruscus]|uniref:Uncharacterized protein n=1 Tax=Mytilus coruscus TaxID=42192 RepID=A0A6J8EVV3_MYTCO|nr:unnamed protein product [Mytilus coruscus]